MAKKIIQKTAHLPSNKLALYQRGDDPKRFSLSLPVGVTCPFAGTCRSYVDRSTRLPVHNAEDGFLCVSASIQTHPRVDAVVWHNYRKLVQAIESGEAGFFALIGRTLDSVKAERLLLHEAGDFFSLQYLRLWLLHAEKHPHIEYEFFTKNISWIIGEKWPPNVKVVVSAGGTEDRLIQRAFEAGAQVHLTVTNEDYIGPISDKLYPDDLSESVSAFPVSGPQFEKTKAGDFVNKQGTGNTMPRTGTTRIHQTMKKFHRTHFALQNKH